MTEPAAPGPQDGEIDFTVESLDGRARLQYVHRPAWLSRRRAGIAVLMTMLLVGAYLLWVTGLAGQW